MESALSPERQRLLQRLCSQGHRVGHDVVAHSLAQLGVTHVFGLGGVPVDATLAACVKLGLRVIGARHQQGAVRCRHLGYTDFYTLAIVMEQM